MAEAVKTQEALAGTIVVAASGAGLFTLFCPSFFAIRAPSFREKQEENVAIFRQGEVAATGITLAVGWAKAVLSNSRGPIVAAVITSSVLLLAYEWALHNPSIKSTDYAKSPLAKSMNYGAAK